MKEDLSIIKELPHTGEDEKYVEFRKWLNSLDDASPKTESGSRKNNK